MKTTQRPSLNLGTLQTQHLLGRKALSFLAVSFFALLPPAQAQVPGTPIYVLTETGSLATATLDAPGTTSTPVAITGVTAGDTLVSIDVRPQNHALYALGVNATADTMTLYHISPQTALAVALGTPFSLSNGVGTIDLPDTSWDIDFNPAVDRLRVETQSGLNFRINPNNGTPVDGDGVAIGVNPDGAINGPTTTVNGTAYTNSQPNNGSITTQYTLDATTNALYIQNPPNNGTQTSGQTVTVGGNPLDFTSMSGFDIEPGVNAATSNTAVASGIAYTVLRTAGTSKLYQLNLVNGQATAVGDFSPLSFAIRPRLGVSIGLAATGTSLVRFSPFATGTSTSVALGSLTAGETMVGIDMRPATGQFYGLGINPTADTGTLYLVDPQTGAVTVVGVASQIAYVDAIGNPVDFPAVSVGYDIDFNPTVDRLRVITGSGLNMRANPITGGPVDGNTMVAGNNTDGGINGPTTTVHATAYTNSFGGTTATTQYTLDATTNSLYIQNPPNNGTQTAGLGITTSGSIALDFSSPVGFDILGSVAVATSNTPAAGNGFFIATGGGISNLYRLDLSTGVATDLGVTATPLASLAMFSISAAPGVNAPTVANLAPTSATLGGTVTDDGGSPITQRGIVFAPTVTSANPAIGGAGVTQLMGMGTTGTFALSATGLTTGTSYSFRAYATSAAGTTYSAAGTFAQPILVEPVFPTAMVSENYTLNLVLAAGTTVTATGLPIGLKLNSTTGVITGRLSTPGVYQITFSAKGPGGLTTSYISTLIVQSLPRTAVGTFLGLILPDPVLNGDAAGRLDLTTTSKGSYTLKITQLTKSFTVSGYLTSSVASTPMLLVTLTDGTQVNLTLQSNNSLTGMISKGVDQTNVTGWRRIFDKIYYPANPEMGYYTISMKRTVANAGNALVPQGSGYASVTIGEDGSTKIIGQAADGSALTSTGFLGPNGEIFVYVPLYGKLGSVFGLLAQTNDINGNYTENTVAGSLFLTKPATTGRTYPAAFPMVELNVQGKYLAHAATGSIVLGLPSSSVPSTLDFTDGGISAASINPDIIDAVTYLRPSLKVTVPLAGSAQNQGRVTLSITATNGSVNGTFTLMDGVLKRLVKFQGMIVRSADGSTTANGYFLMPQIPGPGETASTSPILSGSVDLLP